MRGYAGTEPAVDADVLVELQQTPLPGVGVRYDFGTDGGRRVGLVARRGGLAELLLYDQDDVDEVSESVVLQPQDRQALAELAHRAAG